MSALTCNYECSCQYLYHIISFFSNPLALLYLHCDKKKVNEELILKLLMTLMLALLCQKRAQIARGIPFIVYIVCH